LKFLAHNIAAENSFCVSKQTRSVGAFKDAGEMVLLTH